MKTFTRFLALSIAVLTTTAGAALGSIAVDHTLDALPRDTQASSDSEETQDDANSGKDASGSKGSAMRLENPGRYDAHFKDLDSDWYVHGTGTTAAKCVQVTSSGERLTDSRLEVDSYRSLAVKGGDVTFGLAAVDVQDVHFLFSTDGTKVGSKRYDFATSVLSSSGITSDYGGSDASGTLVGATASPDGCFGGTLNSGTGDTADVYTFSGTRGDQVVFTMAQASSGETLEISLVAPNGTTVGRTGSGGSISATLDATGSWYLVVEVVTTTASAPNQELSAAAHPRFLAAESGSDYTVGACRPLCEE